MIEWMLAELICATGIALVAHTIDEALSSAQRPRAQSHQCPDHGVLASPAHSGNDDEPQRRAA